MGGGSGGHDYGPLVPAADEVHIPCPYPPKHPAPSRPPVDVADIPSELIAPSSNAWEHFSPDECDVAEWLAEQGVNVLSIRERDGHGARTPDAVRADLAHTIELKTLNEPTQTAVITRVRAGRGQSRRIVIDGRAAGLTRHDAEQGIGRVVGMFGSQLQEILVVPATGTAVYWFHG